MPKVKMDLGNSANEEGAQVAASTESVPEALRDLRNKLSAATKGYAMYRRAMQPNVGVLNVW